VDGSGGIAMAEFTHIESRYLETIARQLQSAKRGKKRDIIQEAADFLSCSVDRVYQGLKSIGYSSERKQRTDKGVTKAPENECRVLAGIITSTTRNNGKTLMSIEDALEIGRSNGLIVSSASSSTFSRAMKGYGFHPTQLARPSPHQRMRSLYPNHVWQVDASICVLYYLKDGSLQVMDEMTFNKNKPKNVAKIADYKLIRYVATDHRSDALFVKYYHSPGESQQVLFRFLVDAFTKRDHPSDPFHGVPEFLYSDAGAANESGMIKNLLDRLGVTYKAHIPGNPRAKGQVERAHEIVERKFESRLAFLKISSIEELNLYAHKWMRHFNGTAIHSRTGTTRYAIWQKIPAERIRKCPELNVCKELLTTEPVTRKVQGDLSIRFTVSGFTPATYSVREIPGIRVGESVNVCVNPYRAPDVYVITTDDEGTVVHHSCSPVALDDAGFPLDAPIFGQSYLSQPDTDVDTNRKAIMDDTFGASTPLEVKKARSKGKTAFGGEIDPFKSIDESYLPTYLSRAGVDINVRSPGHIEIPPVKVIQVIKLIKDKLGRPLTPDENQLIREACPSPVAQEELEALLTRLHERISGYSGPKTPVAGLRGI
jgi:hypothetical protein